jgi:S1-C subfamily serine protease
MIGMVLDAKVKTGSLSALAAVLLAAAGPAAALDAAQVLEKARGATFMVIVASSDFGVVDVLAQGSAVLIAPGRLATSCPLLDRGGTVFVARREDKISERARIVGRDSQTGLCELDVLAMKPAFATPAKIGAADKLRVGDPVYAVGSPQGMDLAASEGIVAALRDADGNVRVVESTIPHFPGSNGSGLFDAQGRLVGVVTPILKDARNPTFAVSARHLKSAGISAAELAKQRSDAAEAAYPIRQVMRERAEVARRQEQAAIEQERKDLMPAAGTAPRVAAATPAAPARKRNAREMAALLATYEKASDQRAVRTYDRMSKAGELAGLDDEDIVRKVYGAVIRDQVVENLRWTGGGTPTAGFQVQLRRNGELMFALPEKSSGNEAFDRETQRAIGAASPFPVPNDNAAFEQMRTLSLEIRPPKK